MGLLSSLLLFNLGLWPLRAAESLEVEIDGVVLPVTVGELGRWVRSGGRSRSELTSWLMLLDAESRQGLIRLLQAPILTQGSLGQQMLRSWAAGPLLDAFGDLLRVEDVQRVSSEQILAVLEHLLRSKPSVSALDVLEALPSERVRLDLDALVLAASRWRRQMRRHQGLTASLAGSNAQLVPKASAKEQLDATFMGTVMLAAPHRPQGVRVQIWPGAPESPDQSSWILLMPGLGGDPEHFHWLARAIAAKGWSVAVLDHPGSDAAAVQALLEGRRPFVGKQALLERIKDLEIALHAQRSGQLPVEGDQVVLIGHSLGALTALLAGGVSPVDGLRERCNLALEDLPLTNLSKLLQCELAASGVLTTQPLTSSLRAVVGINSFGSLVWPMSQAGSIEQPLLLMGGTLDLITPPLSEQLALLSALGGHPASRAVIVEGASHFSPIRVEGQSGGGTGDDLFRLSEELVGVQPLEVQRLLSEELILFLEQVEAAEPMGASRHLRSGSIRWHRLNRRDASRLVRDNQ